jgi:tetratricopeptide (TPR) repeat protein
MMGRWRAPYLIVLLAALLAGHAQTSSTQASVKSDYSQEAAVIEEMSIKLAFENDGNSTREQTSRVRVQTDAGVQQWGLLSFPFQSATQVVEIDYVRVHKTDGTTLVTPPDNVQDLDSEITRSAPFYSDLREKHVVVKGLGKGDILEYKAHWRTTKTLTPGQFYFQYNFHNDGIVLNERLEARVPRERAVKVKGPQTTQSITTEGDARIYAWTHSQLKSHKETGHEQKKQIELALGRLPPPDVQISSFQSWEEVGQWYWNLQKERVEPTAAIRAKAAELTKGLTDDASKLQALYSFVSLQYRYIGIAFGIGRYQPHTADDILTNNYGDCKDKQTLLASLLQASGITLHPALISSTWQLDADIPSPAQFDHVIGYLPQGKTSIWLDTTPEVAPVGYLVPRLRDKQALVMSGEKPIQLVTTPANLPFSSTETFSIDGKLGDDGTLEAKVEDTSRGDAEVHLRAAFRQTPQAQWKDLVQRISYALGYAGTVKDVNASAPEVNTEPFRFSYSYNRKDYPDWSTRQFTVPGLSFYMAAAKDDTKDPVWLGPHLETISNSRVALPKDYKPDVPSDVDLKYDFAEYHASYSDDKGVLVAKRRLLIKLHEVPVSELEDYRNFIKNLNNDVNRYVTTSSTSAAIQSEATNSGKYPPFLNGIWQLPDSDSPEANRLEADARSTMKQGDHPTSISGLKRVVELDPKFTRAWLELGLIYMASGKGDSAVDALRKAINLDPSQLISHKVYASVLTGLHRPDAAIDAWREIVKIAPDDPQALKGLITLLMQQKRYGEAVPYLESAAKNDSSSAIQNTLGTAYLHLGQVEKGTAILEKIVQADSSPLLANNVAYELANGNADLPKALEYAQRAVEQEEMDSHAIDLSHLLPDNLAATRRIGSYWDTLGWVHFRIGNLAQAESFLNAAWLLSQDPVEADHLGQVYEQQKKTAKAIHMYRLALATPQGNVPGGQWDETRNRLAKLTGTKAPTGMELLRGDPNGNELSQLRSVKLKRLVPGSATAELFLLFSPGPKVEGVEFISGSEKLKPAEKVLSATSFQVTFPEGSSARLVRRAIVMCSDVSGCTAVLFTPSSVNSVK